MIDLLAALGNRDRRPNGGLLGDRVADAVVALARACSDRESPHEWDTKTILGHDGEPKDIKLFPRTFVARLEKAISAGAFSRMPVNAIVQRILTTETPSP